MYEVSNMPKGTIKWFGFYEKGWKEITPQRAFSIMREYMNGLEQQEFDRMIRFGLRGESIRLVNGGSRFQFIPKK